MAAMDLTTDFKAFQDLVQASLINVTRSAGQVSNQDLSFHRSTNDKFSRSLDRQNAHLLRLINKLLKAATQDSQLKVPSLQNQDGIDDNWRKVVDVVDGLLERADSALDEFSGVIKPQAPSHHDTASPKPAKSGFGVQRAATDTIPKPQLHFDRKVNNSDSSPFRPLLQSKPHAIVPLAQSIGNAETGYKHPYAHEIERCGYPVSVYKYAEPVPFTPINESQPVFVDTEQGVLEMLEELKQAKEIAVDLEHNDLRSYVGMVSLMQISTRHKDWIIDTLKPWREKLQMLNEVFANPNVLKVLHGSNMDIIWLQRDLGLYMVNLLDTYWAAVALQFHGKGLKHLLMQFANVEAQKQYQLADWRIRPLPQELLDYARSDTHYLLNIYDHIRNMLIQGSSANINLINYVRDQSKKEALQTYTRQAYDIESGGGPQGWLNLLTMRATNLSKEQLGVFRALHAWRDRKARDLDEGIQYILPNRVLWLLAESMPMSTLSFHQALRGDARLVRDSVDEIVEVVKEGRARGKDGMAQHELIEHCEKTLGITIRRRPPPRERPQQPPKTTGGVGDVLKQIAATRAESSQSPALNHDSPVDFENPVARRTASSAFWGEVAPQSQLLPAEVLAATEALSSILPLHKFTPETTTTDTSTSSLPLQSSAPTPSKTVNQNPTPKDRFRSKADEIFTLNDHSRNNKKRKAEDDPIVSSQDYATPQTPGLGMENGGDETPDARLADATTAPILISSDGEANDDYAEQRSSKKSRKAEKKARKEAERLATLDAEASVQPFDYANAPSMLKPTSDGTSMNGQAGKEQKRMNPFAKSLDTSTGARRGKMGKELGGKSMTFKS